MGLRLGLCLRGLSQARQANNLVKSEPSAKTKERFQEVNPGAKIIGWADNGLTGSPHVFYLARSVEEFVSLGGEIEPQYEKRRSMRCVIDKIDRETGVVDLTILLDLRNRKGKTLRDVPFEDPFGPYPGFDNEGGSWHFITSCR